MGQAKRSRDEEQVDSTGRRMGFDMRKRSKDKSVQGGYQIGELLSVPV